MLHELLTLRYRIWCGRSTLSSESHDLRVHSYSQSIPQRCLSTPRMEYSHPKSYHSLLEVVSRVEEWRHTLQMYCSLASLIVAVLWLSLDHRLSDIDHARYELSICSYRQWYIQQRHEVLSRYRWCPDTSEVSLWCIRGIFYFDEKISKLLYSAFECIFIIDLVL